MLLPALKYYRVCAACQTGWGCLGWFPVEWLCPACEKRFYQESQIAAYKASMYDHPIYCLMLWNNQNHEFISPLIQSLKGNYNKLGWSTVVKVLVREMILKGLLSGLKPDVIVPAPSHNPDRQHAQVLAKTLACQLNIPVALNLLQIKKTSQKSLFYFKTKQPDRQTFKSKAQRSHIQIKATKHKYKNILFVDDICTTGSTIAAAKQALGHSIGFQPLVLAGRTRNPL